MQALVKTPHTDIRIQGEISSRLLALLKNEYGKHFKILDETDECIDITRTNWYRHIKSKTTPGDALRIYRQNAGLTAEQLSRKLANISAQTVVDMESGLTGISQITAEKLGTIFSVPAERFLAA